MYLQADLRSSLGDAGYIVFGVILFVWELLPTSLVVFFFRVRRPPQERVGAAGGRSAVKCLDKHWTEHHSLLSCLCLRRAPLGYRTTCSPPEDTSLTTPDGTTVTTTWRGAFLPRMHQPGIFFFFKSIWTKRLWSIFVSIITTMLC